MRENSIPQGGSFLNGEPGAGLSPQEVVIFVVLEGAQTGLHKSIYRQHFRDVNNAVLQRQRRHLQTTPQGA